LLHFNENIGFIVGFCLTNKEKLLVAKYYALRYRVILT